MTIEKIKDVIHAEVLYGIDNLDQEISHVFSSDMMSDVLAFGEGHSLLITGLCNPQIVRTAEMMDIVCIIIVRGKQPDGQILCLAHEKNIVILRTKHHMFTTCGILYEHGLLGGA